ncbi:MAG: ABC transporter ATP-binding protein [Gammaproteobacteria bacterium]
MPNTLAVETRGLSKSYGCLLAVDALDLSVAQGSFFGLLGRNGSGKTTTLHMLSTLVRPSAGQAWVAGHEVVCEPVAVRRAIGVVFQESALDRTLTVVENLRFAGALAGLSPRIVRQRCAELLKLFDLEEKRHAPVSTLSGGMRRAIDIARGVLHRPRILFLDEPTIGLDVINRRQIWRFLHRLRTEEGSTLMLSTHYMEEVEGCDEVVFMKNGKTIGQGRPAALICGVASFILEVETETPALSAQDLTPRFGEPLAEEGRLQFRILDRDFALSHLPSHLERITRGIKLRRADLNDVYLWLNRPGT